MQHNLEIKQNTTTVYAFIVHIYRLQQWKAGVYTWNSQWRETRTNVTCEIV